MKFLDLVKSTVKYAAYIKAIVRALETLHEELQAIKDGQTA